MCIKWILAILLLLLLIVPQAAAQEDDEEQAAGEDACIIGTFCGVMIFIVFLIYISAKKKPREPHEIRGTNTPRYPPRQQGARYPPPRGYPSPSRGVTNPQAPPQPKDIKCDLCGSKNLRHFEHGYAKCNDCKHVMYTLKGKRKKRI